VVTFQDKSVVIVGGGHNGLTAAAYLAKAGVKVTVLERLSVFGGAAISAQAFEGIDAKLSRYSYLVSLLPKQIIEDLDLDISLAPRRYSSYTPIPGQANGLLVDNQDPDATRASFEGLGAGDDFVAWRAFYSDTQALAAKMWPSVLRPLQRRSDLRTGNGNQDIWEKFIELPIGDAIRNQFKDDWVRGVVYTDALIGTFASNRDETLNANKCFLYHVIGGGTGDWNVPIGGMGAVSGELQRAATRYGAELVSEAEVLTIETDADGASVRYRSAGQEHELKASLVLTNSSRQELAKLMRHAEEQEQSQPSTSRAYPYGAQVKVNLLLKRLPKLRDDSVSPEAAFGGTFHINESFEQLQSAYESASRGEVPNPMPCEIYCHSLTDPSILGPELRASGAQTLTVFALHAPHSLVANLSESEHDAMRAKLEAAVLSSLNSVLAEPIEDLLMIDGNGDPCLETKTTRDLEAALRLPGGNIFHEPLSWPFAEDEESLSTPAERWGVATSNERVLLCGSSAKRGGAVSGIAGHNAAMAALELFS
jgi:phytoene dehydrogenase-like protein